ncbi:disease resistance protein RPV1-like [Rhododendron vialii]|uniref:disease resistance protein RPV1-like n=1 Tax=Rhododendron vialii TaxID=182163 RepID=UPI00265FF1E9|nr:disease resistance protein RPV1-like [Rhododendron vialii]
MAKEASSSSSSISTHFKYDVFLSFRGGFKNLDEWFVNRNSYIYFFPFELTLFARFRTCVRHCLAYGVEGTKSGVLDPIFLGISVSTTKMASTGAFTPSLRQEEFELELYDVFLSFSGVDTRNNFTSHLLAALERHGFHTFRDNTNLNRGEDIGYELLKAIEDSRISLVVLSRNYAASGWCLDELVKIMECWKTLQHIVFPIFHGVGPTDVRAQKGSLAKAFAKHAERFKDQSPGSKVEKWKEALTQISNLSGWDLPKLDNGQTTVRKTGLHCILEMASRFTRSESRYICMTRDEAKLIQKIVEEVGNRLDIGHLNVADHQVGMESRMQELNVLLRMESSNVRIVGIWGIGGIGKTTIAMKQFNVIRHMFEGSGFLVNVAETSKQPNGLICLQEQLLLDICSNGTHNIRNSYQGIEVIKRRAFCRKVLLVLDDVDNVQQLKALAIDQDSFRSGTGSRIIITTRDVSLLNLLKVDEIYAAKELNRSESLQLLSWHAFKEDHPKGNYLDLSDQVVAYAGGIPLALEVLGSFLYGKSIHEWKSAISKLKKIPPVDVQAKLKISFDSLSDEVKELFLDMACFFAGTYGVSTIKILEGCNFFATIGIRVLADRCLIKYGPCNELLMHDLIRGMGREIVRQESVKEPGRRSRLWYKEDALEVLRDGMGTEAVEGLFLNLAEPNDIQVNPRAFEKMNRLWLLHLNYVNLSVGYEHISKRLLWLCWNGFPLKCVPSKLYMENLVTLDLSHSRLKQVWKGTKILGKLKFLYLSHCYCLTKTPDFSGLNNLQELLLNDCIRLVEVDDSIRFLKKLVVLDMKNCKKLQKLPSSIWMLKTLENLDLSGCSMLGKYSGIKLSKSLSPFLSSWNFRTKRVDSIGLSLSPVLGLSCLKELSMKNCNLSCLPNEVGNLISLEILDLSRNNLHTLPDSICNLTRLKKLYLSHCDVSHLPSEIGRLVTLETLILEGNSLVNLPDSICNLTRLKNLNLSLCDMSHLPSEIGRLISLQKLNLGGNNLLTLPDSICNLACLEALSLPHCNVSHLPDRIGMLSSLKWFNLRSNNVSILPNSFSDLASLEILHLNNCGRLQSLPKLPASLCLVNGINCTLLPERIPTEFNWPPGLFSLTHQEWSMQRMIGVYLPGDEVPNFYPYQYTGSKLSLVVPPLETRRIIGWALCIVFRTHKKPGQRSCMYIFSKKTEGLRNENKYKTGVTYQDEDRMNLMYFPSLVTGIHLFSGDELEIEISPDDQEKTVPWLTVKKCGIRLVYEDDGVEDSLIRGRYCWKVPPSVWIFSMLHTRNLSKFLNSRKRLVEGSSIRYFNICYRTWTEIHSQCFMYNVLKEMRVERSFCVEAVAMAMAIMECRKTLQHIVLPIFYDVEPFDVQTQKGSLAGAFANHEEHI